ncbi:MAG: cation:proton antiporter [Candidatus Woesearchaeota archaeon]
MSLILFLAGAFLVTFIIGRLLERVRVPWIFSALLIGLGLAAYNPFSEITSSESFNFLAQLGMFFLLFIIGFELDLSKVKRHGRFIVKTTLAILIAETVFGSLLVHYVFGASWLISILVASSFATVGEAVLLPVLDEFRLIKTDLGQTIIGVGVLDDIVEVLTVIFATVLISRSAGHTHFNIWTNILVLAFLFGIAFAIPKLRKHLISFRYKDIPSFFLFVIFFIFLLIGIGQLVESAALGALLAGMAMRNMIPEKILNYIDSEIKTMAYGFFAPIFFLGVGLDTDISYLVRFPLLILLVMVMTKVTKVVSSYLVGRKELGSKKSILLGVSLCVKFSTSVVIIKLLFEKGLIQSDLYSVLIGTMIAFKFIVPLLLSYLITKWGIGFSRIKQSKRMATSV